MSKNFEIKEALSVVVCFVFIKTNRFHVAVRLFSNRSQKNRRTATWNVFDKLISAHSLGTVDFSMHLGTQEK